MRLQASKPGCFTSSDVQRMHHDKAGSVRCRDSLLHGEQNLADERALVNLLQDVFTLEFQEQPRLLKNPSTDGVSLLSVLRCGLCD